MNHIMRHKMRKLCSSYVHLLLYVNVSRLRLPIPMTYRECLRDKIELMEWVDHNIAYDVKLTSHQGPVSNITILFPAHRAPHFNDWTVPKSCRRWVVTYNNDTADRQTLWCIYMCKILTNHASETVLNHCDLRQCYIIMPIFFMSFSHFDEIHIRRFRLFTSKFL